MSTETVHRAGFELRYQSLFNPGRGLAFPCDAEGTVDTDTLSSAAFNNYLHARAFVGREFHAPSVRLVNY